MARSTRLHSPCSCLLQPLILRRISLRRPAPRYSSAQQTRAAAEPETKPSEAERKSEPASEAPKGNLFKPLTIIEDNESFTDVFAFAGSLPEVRALI